MSTRRPGPLALHLVRDPDGAWRVNVDSEDHVAEFRFQSREAALAWMSNTIQIQEEYRP